MSALVSSTSELGWHTEVSSGVSVPVRAVGMCEEEAARISVLWVPSAQRQKRKLVIGALM